MIMYAINFSKPRLLLPPGPERITKCIVSRVTLPKATTSALKLICSETLNAKVSEFLDQSDILLFCECSLIQEYVNGKFRYNVTSVRLSDDVNNAFLDCMYSLIQHHAIKGILLFGYNEVANIAFSYAMRHFVRLAKFDNWHIDTEIVTVGQIFEKLGRHISNDFFHRVKECDLLQINGINPNSLYYYLYGTPVYPVREILEIRFPYRQFNILSANMNREELNDYFGARLIDTHLSTYLNITMMNEPYE